VRLIILTCGSQGTASRILPDLVKSGRHSIVQVVLARGGSPHAWKYRWRRLRKVLRIGILGALNGVRLRKWYQESRMPRIDDLCREFSLPFVEVPFINCDQTVEIFKAARADLGLSLGNGYIASRVFSIPKHGMINLHTEVLPKFQGASSIIWPIYELVAETGFTIHQVNNRIDQGAILYRHVQPIVFYETLQKTVEANLRDVREKTPAAVLRTCDEYASLSANAEPQTCGPGFTTPTIFQYWRMVRNHARMRAEYLRVRNGGPVAADGRA